MKHELKTWPKYFQAILKGEKKFEIRSDEDKDFEVFDILVLKEFNPDVSRYTGRELSVSVTSCLRNSNPFIDIPGYVIMSIKPLRQSLISKLWNKIFDLN